jgi:hypothetical protein
MTVHTLIMRVNTDVATPASCSLQPPGALAVEAAADSAYWIARGLLVGLALGASAGSVVPLLGTVIGAVLGALFGFTIGLATALFATVTRRLFPAGPSKLEVRERIACLVVIWSPLPLLFIGRTFTSSDLIALVPMGLGSIHAIAAGTPVAGAIYTGKVSKTRSQTCKLLPLVVLLLVAVGFGATGIASLQG